MNKDLKQLIFRSIALAMGVATLVLNIVKTVEMKNSLIMLSIGLVCLAISEFESKKEN